LTPKTESTFFHNVFGVVDGNEPQRIADARGVCLTLCVNVCVVCVFVLARVYVLSVCVLLFVYWMCT
jgi:hypothetical protein